LTYLRYHAPKALEIPGADRLTPELLADFVARLESRVSPRTTCGYLHSLRMMVQAMWPAGDWSWLHRPLARLHQRAGRSQITEHDLVPVDRLFAAGLNAMRSADALVDPIRRAVRFRDGLMLALNAAAALRCRNLAMIQLGRHLIARGDGYVLAFQANEMKARRRHEVPLPPQLTPLIERYLSEHRPVLLNGATHDAFWVTQYGMPQGERALCQRFPKLTRKLLGKRLTSHKVRHCLASSIVDRDPGHARIAATLLGHAAFSTTEAFYIRGSMLLASRAQGNLIAARRAAAQDANSAGRRDGDRHDGCGFMDKHQPPRLAMKTDVRCK
jgi:integrase